ncbi:hypothetical protein T11_5067, partial [Trichinella zimbabwensis]
LCVCACACMFNMVLITPFSIVSAILFFLARSGFTAPTEFFQEMESVPYLTFAEGSQLNSKHCYKSEPCQFGKYKQQPDAMLTYIHIPSWCVCKENERCALEKYDRKKKVEIYTCRQSE